MQDLIDIAKEKGIGSSNTFPIFVGAFTFYVYVDKYLEASSGDCKPRLYLDEEGSCFANTMNFDLKSKSVKSMKKKIMREMKRLVRVINESIEEEK